jgi:hypothetical protein
MACKSAVIAYPPPWYLRRSAPGRVRPARRRGPELTGAFPADVDPARLPSTFAQVTALRPKAEMVDSSNPFWIPPPGTREGPRPAFPQVRGPLSTWWQVKDSNLRSFRDGFTVPSLQACDQQHWPIPQQLPRLFPTDSRLPPTTAGHFSERFAFTASRHYVEQDASDLGLSCPGEHLA